MKPPSHRAWAGGHLWDPGNKDLQADKESERCGLGPGKGLQRPADLFCEGPESKYLRLCRLNCLSLHYSVLSLQRESRRGLSKGKRVAYLQNSAEDRRVGDPWVRGWGGRWQLAPEQARRSRRKNPAGLPHGLLGRCDSVPQRDQLGSVSGAQSCGFRETGLRKQPRRKLPGASKGLRLCQSSDASPGPEPWVLWPFDSDTGSLRIEGCQYLPPRGGAARLDPAALGLVHSRAGVPSWGEGGARTAGFQPVLKPWAPPGGHIEPNRNLSQDCLQAQG